jgi:hypothetical protein
MQEWKKCLPELINLSLVYFSSSSFAHFLNEVVA